MTPSKLKIPRLSETLHAPGWPRCCQWCGVLLPADTGRENQTLPTISPVWQEHDDSDRPEMRFIVLCAACADKLIEKHPRLYRRLGHNEPAPGVMAICQGCVHQTAGRCMSPVARANGGPGLHWPGPDTSVHFQRAGPGGRGRRGEWIREWDQEPAECEGREAR